MIMGNVMRLKIALSTIVFCLYAGIAFGQHLSQNSSVLNQEDEHVHYQRHSIGSSIFLVGNLAPGDHPHYMQLNYGYRISENEAIVAEAITWNYYGPLGTYEESEENYPGKVRAMGLGLGYQRFFWKSAYSTVQATPFLQQFIDIENDIIQSGFQLFLQLRVGYRFEFLDDRWFIEPSVAFNYWPVNTNFPEAFENVEEGAPNYYLFEPGLHFGFRF